MDGYLSHLFLSHLRLDRDDSLQVSSAVSALCEQSETEMTVQLNECVLDDTFRPHFHPMTNLSNLILRGKICKLFCRYCCVPLLIRIDRTRLSSRPRLCPDFESRARPCPDFESRPRLCPDLESRAAFELRPILRNRNPTRVDLRTKKSFSHISFIEVYEKMLVVQFPFMKII